jgi:hypothetical protein
VDKVCLLTILVLVSIFLYGSGDAHAARRSQININLGIDSPDDGEDRESAATMFRASLSTAPYMFRFVAGFTAVLGSAYMQGEFTFGPYFYILSSIKKTPIQPFIFAEGVFGVGTLDEEARTDAGSGLGAGVDIKFAKMSGITFSMEMHSASETSNRIWFGWFTQY